MTLGPDDYCPQCGELYHPFTPMCACDVDPADALPVETEA